MILLWGLPGDTPLMAVYHALYKLGHTPVLIDQRTLLNIEIELCVGTSIEGYLHTSTQHVLLEQVTAAYLRSYDSSQMPVVVRSEAESDARQHALDVDAAILAWSELTPALVVNRPTAMASNNSKPYQANIIQSSGFAIPDTLITTDPQLAKAFWQEHGMVIYKSISSVRSIVSRLSADHIARLERIRWCPTQFQAYIPGHDYRVHVIGDEVFACEITSTGDDYRYAVGQGYTVDIYPYKLPKEVADRCVALAALLEMSVVGIDLRCTPAGQWYCFEVNPSPAFTYYQDATGDAIDEAIARLLIAGAAHPRLLTQNHNAVSR